MREPEITPELVEWLDTVYPDRAPKPTDSGREIWMQVGRVEVVAMLKARLKAAERRQK